jgi:hypothetical protein
MEILADQIMLLFLVETTQHHNEASVLISRYLKTEVS